MAKKRIVEETFSNGKKQYKVEIYNWLLGWKTDLIYDAERDMHFGAIFSTLDRAKEYINGFRQVVSRKVIEV